MKEPTSDPDFLSESSKRGKGGESHAWMQWMVGNLQASGGRHAGSRDACEERKVTKRALSACLIDQSDYAAAVGNMQVVIVSKRKVNRGAGQGWPRLHKQSTAGSMSQSVISCHTPPSSG